MKWSRTDNGERDAAWRFDQLISGAFAVDPHMAFIQTIILQLHLREPVSRENNNHQIFHVHPFVFIVLNNNNWSLPAIRTVLLSGKPVPLACLCPPCWRNSCCKQNRRWKSFAWHFLLQLPAKQNNKTLVSPKQWGVKLKTFCSLSWEREERELILFSFLNLEGTHLFIHVNWLMTSVFKCELFLIIWSIVNNVGLKTLYMNW